MNRRILTQIALPVVLLLLIVTVAHRTKALPPDPAQRAAGTNHTVTAIREAAKATPTPTPEPTEPPEVRDFVISVIGDNTLTTHQFAGSSVSYAARMKGDYAYPYHNTVEYFRNDDFTISNLECTLSDKKLQSMEQFYFLCPSEYARILVEGCVDFVTTANNHMADFGEQGEADTYAALEEYGIPYGKEGQGQLLTTDSGLTLGIYCDYNHLNPDPDQCTAAVRKLRQDGAEYVICAFHWGKELYYSPNEQQVSLAHACIDAGADLIYGSHTHCLQPVERYSGGLILYSMGNWSFGGSTSPTDRDTAIIQVQLHRDETGKVSTTGYEAIPCCVSSRPVLEGYTGDNYNDYCPTPYTEGSKAWNRTLSKLDGSYQATKEGRDYSDVYAQYG